MNPNTSQYWDAHIAEPKFGLRQQKYLELAGKGHNIIELGCGLSPFLDKARKNFKNCYAQDFSPKTLGAFRKKYPGIYTVNGSALNLSYIPEAFDVSVAGELIEHLDKPEKLASEMNKMTKYRMIVSTALMEYDEPEHIQKFTKESLSKLFEPYGKVTVEEVESTWFPGRKYLFLLCQKFLKSDRKPL